MKKTIWVVLLLIMNSYSQKFESKLFGGVSLPIGAEIGLLSETELPRTDNLKLFVKSSVLWGPVLNDKTSTNSFIIAGLQPGLRLKLIDGLLLISGGLSLNPVAPLPFNGLDFGIGNFIGVSFKIRNTELGLYSTCVYGKKVFINKIGWLSLIISKSFQMNNNKI